MPPNCSILFSKSVLIVRGVLTISACLCVVHLPGTEGGVSWGGGGCMHVYTNPVHTVYQASSTIETPVDICELSNHLHG